MTPSFLAAAAEAPRRVALVADDGAAWTYGALAPAVRAAAAAAVARPTLPMPIVAERHVDIVVRLLGLFERGVPPLLVHPRLTAPERERLVGALAGVTAPPGTLAVVPTSGTTGRPRAAALGRDAVVASAHASAARLGFCDDDRWLLAMPLAHVGGLSILVRCLLARAAVVLAPPRFEPAAIAAAIERDRVTLASFVPVMLARLLDAGWRPPAHLRAVLLGGDAAPAALIDRAARAGVPALPTYGLTEACSQVATVPPGLPPSPAWGVGPPLDGWELRFAPGGRVQLRGPALFSGYLGEPSPFDDGGWFDTGDLGALDAAGRLHILGRATDLIVTGGENVHPAEVEPVLAELPGVRAVGVVGVPDPTWGQVVAAAIVADAPEAVRRDLPAHAEARLAAHRRPRQIVFVPELPLTATGKLDRRALARALARVES